MRRRSFTLLALDEKLKQLDFQEKLLEIEEKIETQRLAKDNIIEELTVQIKNMNDKIDNLAETICEKDVKLDQMEFKLSKIIDDM